MVFGIPSFIISQLSIPSGREEENEEVKEDSLRENEAGQSVVNGITLFHGSPTPPPPHSVATTRIIPSSYSPPPADQIEFPGTDKFTPSDCQSVEPERPEMDLFSITCYFSSSPAALGVPQSPTLLAVG